MPITPVRMFDANSKNLPKAIAYAKHESPFLSVALTFAPPLIRRSTILSLPGTHGMFFHRSIL